MEIINCINENQGFAMVILTAVYVGATILILRSNNKNLDEMTKQTTEMTDQKAEMIKQFNEMKNQTEEMASQREEMEKQRAQDLEVMQKQNTVDRMSKIKILNKNIFFLYEAYRNTNFAELLLAIISDKYPLEFTINEFESFRDKTENFDIVYNFEKYASENDYLKKIFVQNIAKYKRLHSYYDSDTDTLILELIINDWKLFDLEQNIVDNPPKIKNQRDQDLTDKILKKIKLMNTSFSIYYSEIFDLHIDVLNELEEFAIYYYSGLIDKKLMYDLYRESILPCIIISYPMLCLNNNEDSDVNMYKNTTNLYNEWYGKLRNQIIEEENQKNT